MAERLEGMPHLMSIRQVAHTGLISEYSLRQLVRLDQVPYIRVRSKVLINFDALLRQLETARGGLWCDTDA